MEQKYIEKIANELSIRPNQVIATATLLEDGGTVPFISRYRKEATGSLDEVAIKAIRDRLTQLKELDVRREAILKSLTERNLLTDELKQKVLEAETMTTLEDVYLPFRPKRRTRATIAKEKGLEPLADILLAQQDGVDPVAKAEPFVDTEKDVENATQALAGARDIIAERISEDKTARERIRELYFNHGKFSSKVLKGKEADGVKYENYFAWEEPVAQAPSHRVLAMRRGEKEGVLIMRVLVEEEQALGILNRLFVTTENACASQVILAIEDGFKRLLSSSIETEIRLTTKKQADAEAIRVFSENLRQLLLAAPLGEKKVLAIDPGFRTGCKTVWLDSQGKLLGHDVIFPHTGSQKAAADEEKLKVLCEQYQIEAIAIGNGTAGRETETFCKAIDFGRKIPIIVVNESGASVYSASDAAREEFPNEDVTVRGAVSIGRRLTDPLAELVKIEPKSIGVGQYQHDVDQTQLKQGLDDVVISCVNNVGVEVNTASKQLLMYVSGLGPQLAQNIVNCRNENGPFKSRKELMNVPRLGAKAFEQAAGFLRIHNAANPLDASAVHPESYKVVDAMVKDLNCSVPDLMQQADLRKKIDLSQYVSDTIGLPTLNDIMTELEKPGRDPREKFEEFNFADGVEKITDLCEGMKLPGIVTNITAFGAFVDIGVHQDGLVHISEMADRFVSDPAQVVKVHQKVSVTVLEVDVNRQRIKLSMKTGKKPTDPKPRSAAQPTGKKNGNKASRTNKQRKVDPKKSLISQLTLGG